MIHDWLGIVFGNLLNGTDILKSSYRAHLYYKCDGTGQQSSYQSFLQIMLGIIIFIGVLKLLKFSISLMKNTTPEASYFASHQRETCLKHILYVK